MASQHPYVSIFDSRAFTLTNDPALVPSLQPAQPSGVPLSRDAVLSDRLNSSPLPSSPTPRPLGLYKPRADPSVGETPSDDGPLQHQMQTPEKISLWGLICVAVALILVVALLFNFDPLRTIIDIESAKQHASIENATLAFEKEKTERERKLMTHERELWEKARDARVPRDAFWDVVWPAWDCRAYGKREYWGILRNVPKDWDAMDACMNMPVEIKGVEVRRPDRCARVFVFPLEVQVRGYWMVDWDQPDCKPWYRDFEDKVTPLLSPRVSILRFLRVGVHWLQLRKTSDTSSDCRH